VASSAAPMRLVRVPKKGESLAYDQRSSESRVARTSLHANHPATALKGARLPRSVTGSAPRDVADRTTLAMERGTSPWIGHDDCGFPDDVLTRVRRKGRQAGST
jgi:hypothetical protein